jgi:hypothetical protein
MDAENYFISGIKPRGATLKFGNVYRELDGENSRLFRQKLG